MNWRVLKQTIILGLFMTAMSASAGAEELEIRTVPPDQGFGEHELSETARFAQPTQGVGRVDERDRLNPLADRSIGWSTGYIPRKGTIQIANTLFLAQRGAYSLSDELQIFGQASLPVGQHSYFAAGSQFQVAEGDSWKMIMGVQARHRRSNFMPGTSDTGLGLHAVFDVIAGDNTTWNAGISGHIPVRQTTDSVDASQCENRREAAEGDCAIAEPTTSLMPSSGYWLALYAGMNHFVTDWLVFNVEAFSGGSQGNFWALDVNSSGTSYEAERELIEDTNFTSGLGPLGAFTLGLGTTWLYRGIGLQTSLYATSLGGQPVLIPYFALAVNFGTSK